MEVPAQSVDQESRCTRLSVWGQWRCNLMALSGQTLCEKHSGGRERRKKRKHGEEKKEGVCNWCEGGMGAVRGGLKKQGRPNGSKRMEEKLVLKGNRDGAKIGMPRGSKDKEKSNFFYGSGSGRGSVRGAVKKRGRPKGSKNMKKKLVLEGNSSGFTVGKKTGRPNGLRYVDKGNNFDEDTYAERMMVGDSRGDINIRNAMVKENAVRGGQSCPRI